MSTNTSSIELLSVLKNRGFSDDETKTLVNWVDEAITESHQHAKEIAMKEFLTKSEHQTSQNEIVKAIYDLKVEIKSEISSLRVEMHKELNMQMWRFVGIMTAILAIGKYILPLLKQLS